MIAVDVESIERATLSAVSPEAQEEMSGWLMPLRRGTVGRAKCAVVSAIPRMPSDASTTVAAAPDSDWAAVFVGEGFDPVDGASRVKTLSRAPQSLFASVREDGRTVAAGMASFSHGWASVHGMRTAQDCRGRGLAGRVLSALADAARSKGYERVFLQVEAHNAAALALYRKSGFELAWTYAYWQRLAA